MKEQSFEEIMADVTCDQVHEMLVSAASNFQDEINDAIVTDAISRGATMIYTEGAKVKQFVESISNGLRQNCEHGKPGTDGCRATSFSFEDMTCEIKKILKTPPLEMN